MVKIILIGHGDIAKAMLETAAKIMSFDVSSVDTYGISCRVGFDNMCLQLKNSLDDKNGTLIMADIFGGSGCNLCAGITHGAKNVNIISGFNLNMLLSALNHRGEMGPDELAAKVIGDGVKSIINVTEKLG